MRSSQKQAERLKAGGEQFSYLCPSPREEYMERGWEGGEGKGAHTCLEE